MLKKIFNNYYISFFFGVLITVLCSVQDFGDKFTWIFAGIAGVLFSLVKEVVHGICIDDERFDWRHLCVSIFGVFCVSMVLLSLTL